MKKIVCSVLAVLLVILMGVVSYYKFFLNRNDGNGGNSGNNKKEEVFKGAKIDENNEFIKEVRKIAANAEAKKDYYKANSSQYCSDFGWSSSDVNSLIIFCTINYDKNKNVRMYAYSKENYGRYIIVDANKNEGSGILYDRSALPALNTNQLSASLVKRGKINKEFFEIATAEEAYEAYETDGDIRYTSYSFEEFKDYYEEEILPKIEIGGRSDIIYDNFLDKSVVVKVKIKEPSKYHIILDGPNSSIFIKGDKFDNYEEYANKTFDEYDKLLSDKHIYITVKEPTELYAILVVDNYFKEAGISMYKNIEPNIYTDKLIDYNMSKEEYQEYVDNGIYIDGVKLEKNKDYYLITDDTETLSGIYHYYGYFFNTNRGYDSIAKHIYEVNVVTNPKCFEFNDKTGEIEKYNHFERGSSNKKFCPEEVIIPDTINNKKVLSIGKNAFYCEKNELGKCKKIDYIKIPNTVEKIDDYAFNGSDISRIEIPSSVKTIGNYAFYDNKNLVKVTFSGDKNNIKIGNCAFKSDDENITKLSSCNE